MISKIHHQVREDTRYRTSYHRNFKEVQEKYLRVIAAQKQDWRCGAEDTFTFVTWNVIVLGHFI